MTDKQKATYFRVQKAGFSISRREGANIILSKQGTEIARIEPNGLGYTVVLMQYSMCCTQFCSDFKEKCK